MKKLMSIAKKASTALAALALVVATTSVPSACFHWFAQPVEPEGLIILCSRLFLLSKREIKHHTGQDLPIIQPLSFLFPDFSDYPLLL